MLREVYLTSGINILHTMQWPLWMVSTSRLISGETQSGVYHSCHSPPPDLTYHHLSPAIRQGCLLGQQMILPLYVRLWQFKKFIYKVHITGTLAACLRVGRVGRGKGREGEMFLPSVLCPGDERDHPSMLPVIWSSEGEWLHDEDPRPSKQIILSRVFNRANN